MIRLLAVSIALLLFGTAAEAGILLESIECDATVVALCGMELSGPDQDQSQIKRIGGHQMTGVVALSHEGGTRSVGILVAPPPPGSAHLETVATSKALPPRDPCRRGLLRPPQGMSQATV
jgi:hypothetical protein